MCLSQHSYSLQDLFDFVASSLKEFIEREENGSAFPLDRRRELGFTFSYPVRQTSVSSGILIKWTKGFAVEDMVGFFQLSFLVRLLVILHYKKLHFHLSS